MAKEREKEAREQQQSRETGSEPQAVAGRQRDVRTVPSVNPFTFMRRFIEDIDRLFEGFGVGPGLRPRIDLGRASREGGETWVPAVEVFERDGQLVVRADVPGLTKDQIKLEVEEGQLIICGERRQEHEERRGGFYRSERSYGSFYRAIPLPEGTNPEQAKATFKDGVLEITVPAPRRPAGRRIEIQEGSEPKRTGKPEAKSA
jgi:HSP20 family protein